MGAGHAAFELANLRDQEAGVRQGAVAAVDLFRVQRVRQLVDHAVVVEQPPAVDDAGAAAHHGRPDQGVHRLGEPALHQQLRRQLRDFRVEVQAELAFRRVANLAHSPLDKDRLEVLVVFRPALCRLPGPIRQVVVRQVHRHGPAAPLSRTGSQPLAQLPEKSPSTTIVRSDRAGSRLALVDLVA